MTFEEFTEDLTEDHEGFITSVSFKGDTWDVEFECLDRTDYETRRTFQLTFEQARESSLSPGFVSHIEIHADHPLLWKHVEPRESIYFSTSPQDPDAVIGRLYQAHLRVTEGWLRMNEHVHADAEILRGGYGCLANAPKKLITAYAQALGTSLKYTRVPASEPKNVSSSAPLRAVIFDDRFILCESFSVREAL